MSSEYPPEVTQHAVDELRERRAARETQLRLEGKTDAAFSYATVVGERVAVLEREREQLREDVREIKDDSKTVLTKLGQLTERGKLGRAVAIGRDLVAVFGLGAFGIWAVVQLLRGAP